MRARWRWLGVAVVALVIAVGSVAFAARYYDGPIGIFAGGPFKSGDIAPTPADWSFLADRDTLQFQTLNPATSRTIWFVVHDGRLFLTSGYMKSTFGARVKRWPYQVETDNRISPA